MIIPICILIVVGFMVIYLIENKSSASEGQPTKPVEIPTKPVEIPQNLYGVPSQLKFKEAWFGGGYVTPYFYHNGRWISLKSIGSDFCDSFKDNYIEPISWRLGNGNFDYEKTKWATVAACLEHNRDVKKRCAEKNISLKRQREDKRNREQAAWKRANS